MNILFNLISIQPSATSKYHGGGYYGEVVFFTLIKRTNNIIGIYNSKIFINPNILNSGIKIYDINKISPKDIVEKEQIDIFYSPLHVSGPEWQFNVKRHIITWHGNRGLELLWNTNLFDYSKNLKDIIKTLLKYIKKNYNKNNAIKNVIKNRINLDIITVSEHSKASIINFFPELNKKNIPVFFSPMENDEIIGDLPNELFPKKYFLLTSGLRWEKNNLRAIFAFDDLFSQRDDINYNVVITGVTDKYFFQNKIKNKNKFISFDFINRNILLALHKNAYAFIFPSLNEGFGYPPLESMRFGVPVAASGTSSIPEICQNAAIYFDPNNITEIKNRILQLLDENIYNEYRNRAMERYQVITEKQKNDLNKIIDYILLDKNSEM